TREEQPFLALNGVQTQSARTYNLLGELDELAMRGVDVVRISPHSVHTPKIVDTFHRCMQGTLSLVEGNEILNKYMSDGPCNGYWPARAGIDCRAATD